MSEHPTEISLEDASIALHIVTLLVSKITIPATRAQEFALLNDTLAELKQFVDSQIAARGEAFAELPPESAAPTEADPE